jgi:hypothetical protein
MSVIIIINNNPVEVPEDACMEIMHLRSENAALREALTFYGDCQTYGLNGGNMKRLVKDAGALARHALRKEAKP